MTSHHRRTGPQISTRGDRRIAAQVVRERARRGCSASTSSTRAPAQPALLDRLQDLLLADLAEPGQLADRAGLAQSRRPRRDRPARTPGRSCAPWGRRPWAAARARSRPAATSSRSRSSTATVPRRAQLGDDARDRRPDAGQLLEPALVDQPVQAVRGLDRPSRRARTRTRDGGRRRARSTPRARAAAPRSSPVPSCLVSRFSAA